MILDFLIGYITNLINSSLALLPGWDVFQFLYNVPRDPEQIGYPGGATFINANPMWYVVETAASLNAFIPIDHAFAMLAISAFVYAILVVYKGIRILIGTIRGAGTS